MFAAVFLIFNYKIFTRYFEHDEAVWADEVLVILFVWIVFWANAFLLREKEQITFDLVYRLLPPSAQARHRRGARRPDRRRLRCRAAGIARLHPVSVARTHAGAEPAARCRLFLLRRVPRRRHPARARERGATCSAPRWREDIWQRG